MSEELYLEKLKIAERIQALESTVLAHSVEMKAWREQAQKLLDKHSDELWGMDDKTPGLKTNMDRLLQVEDGRKWFLRGLGVSVISLGAKTVWEFFKK